MNKQTESSKEQGETKKGYNEKNPAQPEGPFAPASDSSQPTEEVKSNTADKKKKQDEN